MASQLVERSVAQFPKLVVVFWLCSSHALHHLPAQLHGGRQWLRISAQDVAKIYVEEVTWGGQEEIVKVAVSDTQQVGDDAIASTWLDVCVHHLRGDAIWAVVRWSTAAEEIENPPFRT